MFYVPISICIDCQENEINHYYYFYASTTPIHTIMVYSSRYKRNKSFIDPKMYLCLHVNIIFTGNSGKQRYFRVNWRLLVGCGKRFRIK